MPQIRYFDDVVVVAEKKQRVEVIFGRCAREICEKMPIVKM